jgi:hypothetical protein
MRGYSAPRDMLKPDTRLFLNRVALRAMPAVPALGGTLPTFASFHLTGQAASADEMRTQLVRGNYQATYFDDVHLQRYAESDGGSLEPYFTPYTTPDGSVIAYDSLARTVAFPSYTTPGRLLPAWTGKVAIGDAAPAMVSDAEVGAATRVTTAARLREILLPRLELRAVADQAATTRSSAIEIDILANDAGADEAAVALGAPAHGTVTLTAAGKARYTPTSGYVGADSFGYTLSRGEAKSSATVSVTVAAPTVGAWGAGPRSGDKWWTGYGPAPTSHTAFEGFRNRPVDILAVWGPSHSPYNATWDDVAGGAGDDETVIDGVLKDGVNPLSLIWQNNTALPVHFNVPLVPRAHSNEDGLNPQVWFDIAAGNYDTQYRRFGKRMAYLDDRYARQALLVLDLGWEHPGAWYPWSIRGAVNGVDAYTRFPTAYARIVAAIRAGYYSYASKNCPYKFCWRGARHAVARGVHHSAFYPGDEVVDLISISAHDSDPYVTATNWSSRRRPYPDTDQFRMEGWDPVFDLAAQKGKLACFPEWGPNYASEQVQPSTEPAEFVRMVRSYMEERLELFAYDCYFNGKEANVVSNPTWAGATEYKRLWGRAAA